MKKLLLFALLVLCNPSIWAMDATMYQWKSHFAYGAVTQIVDAEDKIFGVAGNAIFSVNKYTEDVETYSKQSGLNGGDIAQIIYNKASDELIIAYTDGMIDFLHNGVFTALPDLQQKSLTSSKLTNKIKINNGKAYFCMPFGIMVVDINKHIIQDTYYVGKNGQDENILDIAFSSDSIFAISAKTLFSIGKNNNPMDYINWKRTGDLPTDSSYRAISVWKDELFVVAKKSFVQRKGNGWYYPQPNGYFNGLSLSNDQLFLLADVNGIFSLNEDFTIQHSPSPYIANDICTKNSTYWLATSNDGIVRQTDDETQSFVVNGPVVNIPYRLKIVNDKLYMLAGQRWATENPKRDANIMIYDIQQEVWSNIYSWEVDEACNYHIFDLMNVAVDPADPEHFYVTTYGTGLLECLGRKVLHQFTCDNSPLESAAPGPYGNFYVRTDGALFDAFGNLWVLNAQMENLLHVASPEQLSKSSATGIGDWYKMKPAYRGESFVTIETPGEMFIDNRNNNWKWIPSLRKTTGIALLDDNGTPQYSGDDDVVYRNSFTDQDGKEIHPEYIYSATQDKEGVLWIGLETGLITIPSNVDFKNSNQCEKIKIARNDGTGLADYLLETERINAIVIDGANRKWFGTEASGVFLVSADGTETIAHYTEDNSPLLSNNILSLALDPRTGRIFIGTGKGLMSFQGDAAMPFDEYSSAYAYPNPVYPEYDGVITITGLMDESIVHITDNAGNLVCETRSNGGIAIWDGKTADGKRVSSGVYNVFCNENAEKNHTLVKILVMH